MPVARRHRRGVGRKGTIARSARYGWGRQCGGMGYTARAIIWHRARTARVSPSNALPPPHDGWLPRRWLGRAMPQASSSGWKLGPSWASRAGTRRAGGRVRPVRPNRRSACAMSSVAGRCSITPIWRADFSARVSSEADRRHALARWSRRKGPASRKQAISASTHSRVGRFMVATSEELAPRPNPSLATLHRTTHSSAAPAPCQSHITVVHNWRSGLATIVAAAAALRPQRPGPPTARRAGRASHVPAPAAACRARAGTRGACAPRRQSRSVLPRA